MTADDIRPDELPRTQAGEEIANRTAIKKSGLVDSPKAGSRPAWTFADQEHGDTTVPLDYLGINAADQRFCRCIWRGPRVETLWGARVNGTTINIPRRLVAFSEAEAHAMKEKRKASAA